MISLKVLAQRIEDGLNAELGTLTVGGVQYSFHITADTGNAEDADAYREGNDLFSYIQGNLITTGSNVQTTGTDTLTAKISAFLEVILPVVDEHTAQGATELPQAVRAAMDGYFAKNQMFMQEEGAVQYLFVAQYQLANSGTRAMRPDYGDSFTFAVAMSYDVIQQGISSEAITLAVGDSRLIYTQLGIRRTTATEPATPSNNGAVNAVNKNVAQSSALILNVSGFLVMNDSLNLMGVYLLYGTQTPLSVSLTFPLFNTLDGVEGPPLTQTYTMYLSDLSIGAEGKLPASFSAQFVEVL